MRAFYPSLGGKADPRADPYPTFRAFCLEHRAALMSLIATRRVQTNEVQHCACLLPAFALATRWARGRPLALVEIGARAIARMSYALVGPRAERGRSRWGWLPGHLDQLCQGCVS